MASNNGNTRLLSLRNILQHFPEFLIHVLPCIADRIVFNSIASCNRDTNEKSKAISPPWPTNYQLPASHRDSIAVWAPDGTRVAYTGRHVITIVDQRHGIIHRINHDVHIWELQFSSDGRFLASADDDHIVRLWDNNVAGNYGLLQEWNVREDIGGIVRLCNIDISVCSKYIVVATYARNRVVIKRVEDGETVRSLTPQPGMQYITEVMFSVDYRAVFICDRCRNHSVIKLWRPYQDDADEDSLITLWEQKELNHNTRIIVSHDKMMIAIQYTSRNKGWLFSIDNNYSCTAQELNVPGRGSDASDLLQFTPDDKCIIYATKKGLKYWSVAERKFIDNEYFIYNKIAMNSLEVVKCSPNSRQLIVYEDYEKSDLPLCMKAIS